MIDSKDLHAMQPAGTMGTDTHTDIGISPCFSCCFSTWKTSMSPPLIKGARIWQHCPLLLVPFKSPLTVRTAAAPPNRNRILLHFTCVKQYSNADEQHHWQRQQRYIDSGSSSDSGKDSGKGINLSTVVSPTRQCSATCLPLDGGQHVSKKFKYSQWMQCC